MKVLPAIYFSAAFYFFGFWFEAFKRDTNMSIQEKRLSLLVLIVATVLWPIAVPICYLERVNTAARDMY